MRLRTVRYCISEGFVSLFKNRLMSLAAIGTIAACLFIFGLAFCVAKNVDFMIENMDDDLSITVFVKSEVTETQINQLIHKLEAKEEVKSVEYVSPEEAWEDFKKQLEGVAGEDALLDSFQEDNPLNDSDNLVIQLYDASQQETFISYLETLPETRMIRNSQEAADMFVALNLLIRYISLALIVILIFIAVLLIANTIKIAVYIRRYEINIMKYIGAKDSFIRVPFLVEGMLIGAIGALIPLLIVKYSYNYIINLIFQHFPILSNILTFVDTEEILSFLTPTFFIVGIGLGVIGSGIAVRKHLKV